jgi:hypothetical protein
MRNVDIEDVHSIQTNAMCQLEKIQPEAIIFQMPDFSFISN